MLRIFKDDILEIEHNGKKNLWIVIDVCHKSSGKESVNGVPNWESLWTLKLKDGNYQKEVSINVLESLFSQGLLERKGKV
jgi:hypothetical protein